METCKDHNRLIETMKAMEAAINTFSDWKVRDEMRQDQTDKMIQDFQGDIESIKTSLNDLKVDIGSTYAKKEDVYVLRKEAQAMDREMRKYVVNLLTLGMTLTALIIAGVQFLLN